MKYSFPPLSNMESEILILGSLPGEESLRMQQYYAYKHNAFWRIMFEVFHHEPTDDYKAKCEMLIENNIALWDMIYSGNRVGSLDSNIKDEKVNDLSVFLSEHKNIKKILLNGKKAEALLKRQFPNINIPSFTMPSTSPANARMRYEEKLDIWSKALLNEKSPKD